MSHLDLPNHSASPDVLSRNKGRTGPSSCLEREEPGSGPALLARAKGGDVVVTFDLQENHLEEDVGSEQAEALFERLRVSPRPDEYRGGPVDITPLLIQQLARELSLAYGEDPDEQPFPLRYPRWRFHCARAKTLLAITAAEQQALAAVLKG